MNAMSGQIQVGMIAGDSIFGHSGANIVGALICAGLVSSISAMMWIGPRVTMTMGEDFAMLRIFAYRSKSGAPSFAIGFQLVIASLLLLTQSFEAVLDFIQFSLALCAFCAVAGVLKLRITAPDLPRPYRAWGYPFTPLIFLGVTGFMMAYLASNRPLESLAGFMVMLAGLIVYWVAQSGPAAAAVQKIGITK
jgi:APA family basic amino acid/polyamine antiporter